jgi:hypothetical protein
MRSTFYQQFDLLLHQLKSCRSHKSNALNIANQSLFSLSAAFGGRRNKISQSISIFVSEAWASRIRQFGRCNRAWRIASKPSPADPRVHKKRNSIHFPREKLRSLRSGPRRRLVFSQALLLLLVNKYALAKRFSQVQYLEYPVSPHARE